MDDTDRAYFLQQFLNDRLARDADLADAAVDDADGQCHAEPRPQELADAGARLMMADRQGNDEAGQIGANQAAFAHQQLALAPVLERQRPDPGLRGAAVSCPQAQRTTA